MLADSALKQMNVLFTTPCYVSNVTMNYVSSCFDLIRESTRLGLNFNTHLHSENLVTRARNEIVKFFLANEQFTHLFFIDSDVSFRPEAAFRLLLANRDVAAGIYPIKRASPDASGDRRRQRRRGPTAEAALPLQAKIRYRRRSRTNA